MNTTQKADSIERRFTRREWLMDLFAGGWEPVAHAAYEGFSRFGPGVIILKQPKGEKGCAIEYSARIVDPTGLNILTSYDPETQMLCGIADEDGSAAVQLISTPAGCPTPREVADGNDLLWHEETTTTGTRRVYTVVHSVALNQ